MSNLTSVDTQKAISRIMPLMTTADFCDRNAGQKGDQEALVDRDQRHTWSHVKLLSDRLAVGFRRLGLKRDARVLVQLPNQAELFLTRLACEKAGVRLITAPTTFRRAELRPIIGLTQPDAAIICREYRGFDHYQLLSSIRTDDLKLLLVTGSDLPSGTLSLSEILTAPIKDHDLAELKGDRYTILDVCQIATTSGTTGIPKCVAVPLYTRLLTGWIHLKRFGVTATETLAAATPIITGTADALVYNGGCAMGARLVLLDHFTPEDTCAALETEGVNVIPLVPTMMVRMLDLPHLARYDLKNLRLVVNHGASLPYAQGRQFEDVFNCRIVQAFGSVDCGGISATRWTDPPEVRLGTVGMPLDDNEVKIVDRDGKELPQGAVGRLLVRGLHADARFFRNAVLNDERRRDGYFDLQELARCDGQGNLILMGRERELIIRGGQNIYPADVEAVLSQHPDVLEVCVLGIPDAEMGERVWAFVVCRGGKALSLPDIASYLNQKGLAKFKWPEALRVVESLPRVAAGHKIDRRKLQEMATG